MQSNEIVARLISNARAAQRILDGYTQQQVDVLVREIARCVYDNAEEYARLAVAETRMGVYEDKVLKNRNKARIIWHSLKDQQSVGIIRRDEATGITEVARPVGVVAAITPCTNPVVTPMCNAMFAVKGRNAIIVAPHPRAKACNRTVLDEINRRIGALGAPAHAIQYLEEPTQELTAELMKQADVVVATGGMAMVHAAYSSGKPAFGVGVGNVQCLLDEGVNIAEAVPKIIAGRVFDNGIICSGEQSVIAPARDYDRVIAQFCALGCAYIADPAQKQWLRQALFPDGVMNRHLVGQSAMAVAKMADVPVPEGTRVLLIEADGVGEADLLSAEKMCPVISTYRYDTLEQAVRIAQANLDVQGRGHSVSFHTADPAHAEYVASQLTVCRVLINQVCSTMNGGSFQNSLTPTTTLGCGSWGNNSISENFSFRHLLNITRISYPIVKAVPDEDAIWG